ncbi:DUF4437 domain-containing protein [Sediminitomix flava]|uniref:Uncharacterized protein DUF4437 n=1 Tax=Sediminitomix flava TaxID=379075 RepID=A0A315Z6H4_SEDFL|nr:DUF4437 domain-containing protein [Sediminitomix flava]PWJ39312.1 uncharacterized protein DUF4437 [Sediminitomix flava]
MRPFLLILSTSLFLACTNSNSQNTFDRKNTDTEYQLILTSDVKFDKLNPARGDQSPLAGTLWGDRNGKEATGFLFRPVDGFQSPPHIHNVTYKGIVINGLVHNDDPKAENMWLPSGSFWTQPKGAVHITSAKGSNTMAYIEIEEGPYLVMPTEEHFDSGEEPINVDQSNMVWLDAADIKWIDQSDAKVAFLWGEPSSTEFNGRLIKLPVNFKGKIISKSPDFRAVVIKGTPQYQTPKSEQPTTLEEGSYFSALGHSEHQLSTTDESILYVRSKGSMEIISIK